MLITNGYYKPGKGMKSAELYNSRTGTWTSAGDMAEMRIGHEAVLLRNGDALVIGGLMQSIEHG